MLNIIIKLGLGQMLSLNSWESSIYIEFWDLTAVEIDVTGRAFSRYNCLAFSPIWIWSGASYSVQVTEITGLRQKHWRKSTFISTDGTLPNV